MERGKYFALSLSLKPEVSLFLLRRYATGDRKSFEANATIDRIFARFRADLWKNPDEVFVDYDQTYGFPTQVRIDYSKDFGEDDFSLIVSDFEVLP